MMRRLFFALAGPALAVGTLGASAADFATSIPMRSKGVSTYYVEVELAGLGPSEFMVDTGSGYLAISQDVLDKLLAQQRARYVKELMGVLANGSEMIVPVYVVDELIIGGQCKLTDVETAVFPGKDRFILGLSALEKAAPFIFSLDPPTLSLSNCPQQRDPAWLASEEQDRLGSATAPPRP